MGEYSCREAGIFGLMIALDGMHLIFVTLNEDAIMLVPVSLSVLFR
jgi:hypothetical protein